jgi:hypothetical protein
VVVAAVLAIRALMAKWRATGKHNWLNEKLPPVKSPQLKDPEPPKYVPILMRTSRFRYPVVPRL